MGLPLSNYSPKNQNLVFVKHFWVWSSWSKNLKKKSWFSKISGGVFSHVGQPRNSIFSSTISFLGCQRPSIKNILKTPNWPPVLAGYFPCFSSIYKIANLQRWSSGWQRWCISCLSLFLATAPSFPYHTFPIPSYIRQAIMRRIHITHEAKCRVEPDFV